MARDIRDQWRAQVIHHDSGLTNATRVLMLELHRHMRQDGRVSVPRNQLADTLGVDASRIRERFKEAVDRRYLDRIERGRPGTTAVYKAIVRGAAGSPSKGAAERPSTRERNTVPQEERPAAPLPSVAKGAHVQPASKNPKLRDNNAKRCTSANRSTSSTTPATATTAQ